jgi:hypothetical protein
MVKVLLAIQMNTVQIIPFMVVALLETVEEVEECKILVAVVAPM